MVMLEELVTSELIVVIHFFPEASRFASLTVHLVRHERSAAQAMDQRQIVVGQVSLVGRHFLDGKVFGRLFYQRLEEAAVSRITGADFHGRNDVGLYPADGVCLDPIVPRALAT